jgi:hypothetical protein
MDVHRPRITACWSAIKSTGFRVIFTATDRSARERSEAYRRNSSANPRPMSVNERHARTIPTTPRLAHRISRTACSSDSMLTGPSIRDRITPCSSMTKTQG